ncbi:UPF0481 protein At3g47200-like [Ipomoea triloba]|uniref:UPF0481 protein At3g47200-like n=1 Tax=Ipomoea triloba TaxID=35885 RepID=UPI00125CDD15|nr:UPF0481 protein At3g47200-like [Ipomoea triloba]
MESQKEKLLRTRCKDDQRLSLTAAMTTEFEAKARRCYSSKFKTIHTDTFRKMMLTDAFFIIHTFLSYDRWCKNPGDPKLQGNPILTTPWRQGNICEDLLMLENQVPFFILVKVYAILTNEEESENCLKKLAMQFFKQVEFGRAGGDSVEVTLADNPKHLLDLFHRSFVVVVEDRTSSSSSRPVPIMETNYWVRRASALSSNGLSFIGTNKGNPLDIKVSDYIGRLRVPTLCINDRTVTVLKNLVAYEQGSPLTNPYFTTLAIFFFNIAPNAEEIKLLREADIINHQLEDDGAAALLLKQLYEASQNCFNACLIKRHLQLIEEYHISYIAWVKSSLMKMIGGAATKLVCQAVVFLIAIFFYDKFGRAWMMAFTLATQHKGT